ncbi:MAG: methyltransferase domain-containing protein [Actinomycetota bacterium]
MSTDDRSDPNDARPEHDAHHGSTGSDAHHGHGHELDQGLSGALRYLRFAPEMWSSDVNRTVIELVAPAPGEVIVDIGAGMGAGVSIVAGSGAQAIAVEPTPFLRQVLSLRRRISGWGDRVEIVDGAAEAIPAEDGSVDAVYAVNSMHHWVDGEQAVAEIVRVLNPNGRVVLVDEAFTDPSHPDYDRFGADHDHGQSGDGEGEHHHGFTMVDAEKMGRRLRDAGLTRVDAGARSIAGRPSLTVFAEGRSGQR